MRISDWSSDVCSSDLHWLQIPASATTSACTIRPRGWRWRSASDLRDPADPRDRSASAFFLFQLGDVALGEEVLLHLPGEILVVATQPFQHHCCMQIGKAHV